MQMTQDKDVAAHEPRQMTEDEEWYFQFSKCVTAALKTCAIRRWIRGGHKDLEVLDNDSAFTADIVSASLDKIERRDPGAFEEVFATQAVALDQVFNQYARMAASDCEDYRIFMNIALKAQSQCRWTMKALLATPVTRLAAGTRSARKRRSGRGARAKKFFKQTIENGKIPV